MSVINATSTSISADEGGRSQSPIGLGIILGCALGGLGLMMVLVYVSRKFCPGTCISKGSASEVGKLNYILAKYLSVSNQICILSQIRTHSFDHLFACF
jgi:hypothetical protein